MKYVTSILLTLLLIVYLLVHGTTNAFELNSIVTVPYNFLTAKEKKEIDCLTENIFHEAAYEPKDGKIAVGLVTLNRVKSDFSSSVCGVVHQKTKNNSGQIVCQFSWLCQSNILAAKRHEDLYNEIREIALYVYFNHAVIDDITKGAIYYHADYVSPGWRNLKKTTKIGRHIFYIDPKVKTAYDGKT